MDDLLAELDQHARVRTLRCVDQLAAEYGEEHRETFIKAFEHPAPVSQVVAALRRRGYKIGDKAVYRHRRGECTCYG